ncbi:hypothetical protein N5C66_21080 [Rhizobium pusense]|uniref:hypothetical protein n=1 Tax=Agrobacterium pusense TaxID=648995 RepID=UPI000D1BAF8C|nr:hypothetical protein [Agrobacterium pusense]MDH0911748.1 hypothetical protein [Agrobacterium pusense]MDH1097819.1 hypothetical protein [Agrobacterium pusense]MDH1114240.1 hypothetical protein [Agrobacterium pusense]MDH2196382.1 hypothetical protein [Agrobacterium pusense]
MRLIPKQVESLWTLFTAPVIWALHFLACYVFAAIYCVKSGSHAPFSFDTTRLILGAITLAALAGIALSAFLAWRQWGFGSDDPPHGAPTRRDRRLFQGFATLLLSGLSFIAVVFVAVPLVFMETCQP